jgi:hypothetical protein
VSEDGNDDFSKATGIKVGKQLNDLASVATQYMTHGLVSFEDGKFGKGIITRGLDESIGELTGRNAARGAAADARANIQAEKDAKVQQIKEEQTRKAQQDVAASKSAGLYRTSVTSTKQQNSLGGSGPDPAKDFLGL